MQKQLSVREDVANGNGGLEGARQVDARCCRPGDWPAPGPVRPPASRNRARRSGTVARRCVAGTPPTASDSDSSGRPWMMTVSIGMVIRACRPIIQSVE